MSSTALFFVDYPERLGLAHRLRAAALANGDDLIAFTNQLSLYLLGRARKIPIHLVTFKGFRLEGYSDKNHESIAGQLNQQGSQRLYSAILASGRRLIERYGIDLLINWNGAHIHSLASRQLAREFDLPIVFVELGNVRGRMLFSPQGSGSDLSIKPEPLTPSEQADAGAWAAQFRRDRLVQSGVPQAASNLRINYLHLLDRLGWLFTPSSTQRPALSKLSNHLLRRKYAALLASKAGPAPASNFMFFPLQVSDDTNLTVRSSVRNEEALTTALAQASASGVKLVIKLHPAERNGFFLREVYNLLMSQAEGTLILANENAAALISRSDSVVTINSTAGLESILFNKPVLILAPTYYQGWSIEDIYWFYSRYLIQFDLFRGSPNDHMVWPAIKTRAIEGKMAGLVR